VGDGDFDGDGKPDLLFQHTDGSVAVWRMNNATLAGSAFLNPSNAGNTTWKVVAIGDFNGDGKVDVMFQNTNGSLGIWYMDGLNLASVVMTNPSNPGAGWTVIGAGDFNGDGKLDIALQHTDGTLGVWYLTGGNNLLFGAVLNPENTGDVNWRAVGVIDLNGDRKPDLLLQNRADNTLGVWYMNGSKLILGKLLNPSNAGGTWQIVAP
jgi:hypothetical protein